MKRQDFYAWANNEGFSEELAKYVYGVSFNGRIYDRNIEQELLEPLEDDFKFQYHEWLADYENDQKSINAEVAEYARNIEETHRKAVSPTVDLIHTDMTAVSDVEEKEAEWLVAGYIPRYQITVMAGDGGSGKTTVWCGIVAAVSNGKEPAFINDIPFNHETAERTVFYFSAEDSTEYVLRRRLRQQGACLKNILTISIDDERFSEIKFDNPFLESLIAQYRPVLVVFDPIQAFVPPTIRMGDRNAMRQCLEPLIGYGQKYGTTFIIVAHSNKRPGAWGRNRIADSADVWDISRSVLIVGDTDEDGVKYLSHEKTNYGTLSDTVLFTIDDDRIIGRGKTTKRDREFVLESDNRKRPTPAKDEAKQFILETLKDGEVRAKDLDESARAIGISAKTLKTAKNEMKNDGILDYIHKAVGHGNGVEWYVFLAT